MNAQDDIAAPEALSDQVIRLREWGTDWVHMLPQPPLPDGVGGAPPDWLIGTADGCVVRLTDPNVLPRHAQLAYRHQWWIRALELGGARGVRGDGVPRQELGLAPGTEISVGTTTLIAESPRSIALRDFCARLLGWAPDRLPVVDRALRAIDLAVACRSPLILRGEADLVPIAYALHRRTLGIEAPFVVCDPRRRTTEVASVRFQANQESGMVAFAAATGGTLCMRNRLPTDFAELVLRLHEPDPRVQLIICSKRRDEGARVCGPVPICVPPLSERASELPRIVEGYAREAIATLGPLRPWESFTDDDLRWIATCAASSLEEIEKATLRLVARNMSRTDTGAGRLLRMAPVSLTRWFRRR